MTHAPSRLAGLPSARTLSLVMPLLGMTLASAAGLVAQDPWARRGPLWSGDRALQAMPALELRPLLRPWAQRAHAELEVAGMVRPTWPADWPRARGWRSSSGDTSERTRSIEAWLFERQLGGLSPATQADARAWFARYSQTVVALDPRGWSWTREKARKALAALGLEDEPYPMALSPAWIAYTDGTLAFYRGQEEQAIQAFHRVLALPKHARRDLGAAAAWGLLRLGADARAIARAGEIQDPQRATRIAWEQARDRVRRVIAHDGAYDPFGLFADTWLIEARRHAEAGRWGAAAEDLMRFAALESSPLASEVSAFLTFRVLRAEDPEAILTEWSRHAAGRALLDAGFASRFPTRTTARVPSPEALRRRWLELCAEHPALHPETRIARAGIALELGAVQAAREHLERADLERPIGRLLSLRIAAQSPASHGVLVPAWRAALPIFDRVAELGERGEHLGAAWAGRLRSELALMLLAQGDVPGALQQLEAAHAWGCSRAWGLRERILERIATPEEFAAWLARPPHAPRSAPAARPAPQDRKGDLGEIAPAFFFESWRGDARHTWARRLLRATGAKPFELLAALQRIEVREGLPPALLRLADELIEDLRAAQDSFRPGADRAAALMRVANTLRERGRHLYATSTSPDHWHRAECAPMSVAGQDWRLASAPGALAGPGALEVERAEASGRAHPRDSYHVRRRAVLLAAEAAAFLPDNSPELAHWLLRTGHWIKGLDPKAADPLYKMLVRRCRGLEIGRAADRKRWFPPLVPLSEIR